VQGIAVSFEGTLQQLPKTSVIALILDPGGCGDESHDRAHGVFNSEGPAHISAFHPWLSVKM